MVASIGTILFLCFLEGILSLDNAVVLALLVRELPEHQRKRALTYGIVGAFLFRGISLFFITHLMELHWIKIVGGAYLLYVAGKEFYESMQAPEEEDPLSAKPAFKSFWRVVISVELMDIAFSVDSILAAVSISNNYYVVLAGGILGIVMMRFAAGMFGKILDRFPRFETVAYVLVALIGAKLVLQGALPQVDFHRGVPAYVFWGSILAAVASGFIKEKA